MLYLDYGRRAGEWIPNRFGGHENLDAVGFLKMVNEAVYRDVPGAQTIAEESTSWPMVSRPTYLGGLGFGFKWNMGWMNDTLRYFKTNPVFRKYHHNLLTFSLMYAISENFVLPLSHDEVTQGKGSLIGKMAGDDEWQQFANLRAAVRLHVGPPRQEAAVHGLRVRTETRVAARPESGMARVAVSAALRSAALGARSEPSSITPPRRSIERDFSYDGFEWIDCNDTESSVISFLRKGASSDEVVLVVCNFTPVPRDNYRLGVPRGGTWRECLNSDATLYGGSGQGNLGTVEAAPLPSHGRFHSLSLRLPPLAVLFFKPE